MVRRFFSAGCRLPMILMMACLLAGLSLRAERSGVPAPQRKYVLAHLMACCSPAVHFTHLHAGVKGETPLGLYQVGEPLPERVKYAMDPLGAAKDDLRLATYAGIDAFGVFLLGNMSFHKVYAKETEAYWQAAQADGTFKLFPELWNGYDNPKAIKVFCDELRDTMAKYDDAWLRIDGKRVFFVAHARLLKKALLDELMAALGGRDKVFLIFDVKPAHADYATGYKYYSKATSEAHAALADAVMDWSASDLGSTRDNVRAYHAYSARVGRELCERIVPSYFVRRQNLGPFILERLGFAGFREDWERTIAGTNRLAYVVTWNDPAEDSGLVPDVNHEYAFLELSRFYAEWFKTGHRPAVAQEQILLFHHPQVTGRKIALPEGGKHTVRHNAQGTPPTDYIGVVAMLKEPATIAVELKSAHPGMQVYSTVAERTFAAGTHFWLIHHPLAHAMDSTIANSDPKNVPEPLYPKPIYPETSGDLVVDTMPALTGTRGVYLNVRRGGKTVGFFRSRSKIVDQDVAGNLCTIGNVFQLKAKGKVDEK